jgi:hypothetical protein
MAVCNTRCSFFSEIEDGTMIRRQIFGSISARETTKTYAICSRFFGMAETFTAAPNGQHQPRTRQAANLRMQI